MTKIYEFVNLSKNNNTLKKNTNSVEGIPPKFRGQWVGSSGMQPHCG